MFSVHFFPEDFFFFFLPNIWKWLFCACCVSVDMVMCLVLFFLVKWFIFFLELSLVVWKSALIVLIHFLNRPPQSSNKPKKILIRALTCRRSFFSFSFLFFSVFFVLFCFFNGTCVFAPFLQNLLEQQKKFSKDDFIGWNIYLERRLCIRVDVEMCFLE